MSILAEKFRTHGQRILVETNWGPVFLTDLGRADGKFLIVEGRVHSLQARSRTLHEGVEISLPSAGDISSATRPKMSAGRLGDLYIISGKVHNANGQNQNGRVYDKSILEQQVEAYKEKIEKNLSLGECDHPEQSVVEWKNVSHLITDLWWNGDDLMGNIALLPAPFKGEMLQKAHMLGIPIGFSSRGLGSVTESQGRILVNDDFQLICWDAVTDPSVHNAFATERVSSPRRVQESRSPIAKSCGISNLFSSILETK